MNTTADRLNQPSDDIDLLLLAERTLLFFRRYKWLYLSAVLIGILLGFLTWRSMPKVYKSRLILHSFTLSNLDYIHVINNWNSLLKSGEHELLSQSLGMTTSSLGKVKQVKGTEIQKVFTPNNPNGFYVDVFVTNNNVLKELQAGILTGLENVEYIKKQLAIKKENLGLLISEVSKEIRKLDSTKTRIESLLAGNGNRSTSLIVDISGLNKQRIELNEKLLYYQQDLRMASAVQVLQGFSHFNKPAGPNLVVWLGLGFIGGMAIAFMLSFLLHLRKRLKNRLSVPDRH